MNLFLRDLEKYKVKGIDLISKVKKTLSPESVEYWEVRIKQNPQDVNNYLMYFVFCNNQYQFEKIEKYLHLFNPEDSRAKFKEHWLVYAVYSLTFPSIFDSEAERESYMKKVETNLDFLLDKIDSFPDPVESTFDYCDILYFTISVSNTSNNIGITQKYGDFTHKCYLRFFPQFKDFQYKEKPRKKEERLKVGFFLEGFELTSGNRFFLEYLNLDKEKFEVYSYSIFRECRNLLDYNVLLKVKAYSKRRMLEKKEWFTPDNARELIEIIQKDKLDVLIILESLKLSRFFGHFRLANVQCITYCIPATTGLKEIDYFFSGELLETEKSDGYYSEKLVRLPKSGFCATKAPSLATKKGKSNFNLPEDRPLYFCAQWMEKFEPKYDYIFPRIAKQVKNAVFIFVKGTKGKIRKTPWKKFLTRLIKAFDDEGVNFDNHVFLVEGKLVYEDYLNFLDFSDVFLDTFGWSGGITSLDAFSYGLPVVTMSGETLKSKQSYAMYRNMEILDLIADNPEEYIELAVKLGLDEEFRLRMKEKILDRNDILFEDREVVKGLEKFLLEVSS